MDEAGGQNHTGGEGLGSNEEASISAEKPAVLSDERNGDSDDSGEENGGDCDKFEIERGRLVSAGFGLGAFASGGGHGLQ